MNTDPEIIAQGRLANREQRHRILNRRNVMQLGPQSLQRTTRGTFLPVAKQDTARTQPTPVPVWG